jgi:hypothetical protein
VSANKQNSCLVRATHSAEAQQWKAAARKKKKSDFDRRYLFNGGTVQSCKNGGTLLQIVESSYHDVGFWIKAADGACFAGSGFRTCDPSIPAIVWGWGFRATAKGVDRFLYQWHDSTNCLWRDGGGLKLENCANASPWGLQGGRLSSGGLCVARSMSSEARLIKCKEGNEHLRMELASRSSSALAYSAAGRHRGA